MLSGSPGNFSWRRRDLSVLVRDIRGLGEHLDQGLGGRFSQGGDDFGDEELRPGVQRCVAVRRLPMEGVLTAPPGRRAQRECGACAGLPRPLKSSRLVLLPRLEMDGVLARCISVKGSLMPLRGLSWPCVPKEQGDLAHWWCLERMRSAILVLECSW